MWRRALIVFWVAIFPCTAVSDDRKLATVVADGIGTDVESAIQRAAEAALTQVVGSFMDVNKVIKKRKEIRDGIRTKTKSITAKTREYSQGSIQNIEILDQEKDGDFIRVSAKFVVRIEEFKVFVEKIVTAKKAVKTGLLAKLKTKRKQARNLSDLLAEKIVVPMLKGGVFIPAIDGEIEEVSNPKLIKSFKPKDGEYVLKYPVKVRLKDNFIENFTEVLNNTAQQKFTGRDHLVRKCGKAPLFPDPHQKCKYSLVVTLGSQFGPQNYQYSKKGSPLEESIVFTGRSAHEKPIYYLFPERHIHLCKDLRKTIWNGKYGAFHPRSINVQFVNGGKSNIREEIITVDGTGSGDVNKGMHSRILFSKGNIVKTRDYGFNVYRDLAKMIILSPGQNKCILQIAKSTTFKIGTKVKEEILSQTEKILLSVVPAID